MIIADKEVVTALSSSLSTEDLPGITPVPSPENSRLHLGVTEKALKMLL